MYMSTRANLDYWSTDNCCVRWSLRTGACTIGAFSLVWQCVMMSAGVLMLVQCPLPPDANLTSFPVDTNLTSITPDANLTSLTPDTNLTSLSDANLTSITPDANLNSITPDTNLTSITQDTNLTSITPDTNLTSITPDTNLTSLPLDTNLTSITPDTNLTSLSDANPTSLTPDVTHLTTPTPATTGVSREIASTISAVEESSGCVSPSEDHIDASSQLVSEDNSNSSSTFRCPWLPEPETEILGVKDEGTLKLVAGIFVTYSSIYCILSFSVVLGTIKKSEVLLQGWVAFTSLHNLLILAFLLVPLPFTTLPHLLFSILHFVASLYMWAVVKSYMHTLKVETKKSVLPEDAITDFSVDGVDVTEIPVEV